MHAPPAGAAPCPKRAAFAQPQNIIVSSQDSSPAPAARSPQGAEGPRRRRRARLSSRPIAQQPSAHKPKGRRDSELPADAEGPPTSQVPSRRRFRDSNRERERPSLAVGVGAPRRRAKARRRKPLKAAASLRHSARGQLRRERDSNPRQAFDLRPLSKRVPSATRSSLQKIFGSQGGRERSRKRFGVKWDRWGRQFSGF